MAKNYTKKTWVDEVLAGAATYNISGTGPGQTITLDQTVSTAGTELLAALMNNIENQLDADDTLLRATPTEITVSSGVLTTTLTRHSVQPESGTTDNVDTINGLEDGTLALLTVSDGGTDTLTYKHGTGNLSCFGESDIEHTSGVLVLFRNGSTVYVAGGGGGGATDAADLTYTPATPADWDGGADPGNGDDAFDQLAERTKDLEDAAGDSPVSVILATSDESLDSSTVLQDDDELYFSADADGVYQFDLYAIWETVASGGTNDVKMGWDYPSGTTGYWGSGDGMSNADGLTPVGTGTTAVATQLLSASWSAGLKANDVMMMHISGVIIVGSTGGTVNFQWAQNVSGSDALKRLAGSCLIVHDMKATGGGGAANLTRYPEVQLVAPDTDVTVKTFDYEYTLPFDGSFAQNDSYPHKFCAMTDTAGVTGTMVVDIKLGGTSIMTTNKLDIETGEKSSATAATQPDLTTTTFSAGDILTFSVDAIHSGTAAKGLKVRFAIKES